MAAVHGGDGNIATESTKLLFVEDIVFGIEAKDYAHLFACFAKLASEHIHRWNTYATADKQRCIACLSEVIAVTENGEYIEFSADGQMAHRLCTYTHYLIYNSEYAVGDVADRDGAAKELTLYVYIHELARENACGIASKLHAIDTLSYLFVGLYFK